MDALQGGGQHGVNKSILGFVPMAASHDSCDKYYVKGQAGSKLYVCRDFISDDFADLMPRCGEASG